MQQQLEQLKIKSLEELKLIQDQPHLEEFEVKYLGRKNGELTNLFKELKNIPVNLKKAIGELINEIKLTLEGAVQEKREELKTKEWSKSVEEEKIDLTQPALPSMEYGHFHPNTIVQRDLEEFFVSMGFVVADGPELESDYYNFTAVNVPENHPARDMQDTFYIKGHSNWVMRTHTSPVQVRAMQKYGAPLRVVIPGKCFRNESTDVRHEHTFYQLEGLVIDKNINLTHLKGTLEVLVRHLYGEDTKLRLRPKYYPFVEPGINGEVSCFLCEGHGCRVCKKTGWLEVLGAGMIHPHVLKEGGVDPQIYQGFAFGLGLTRLVMLKYGIDDVRLLESGSLKFLKQF
jgi:phenylalanyl-tRNA synthetase alpha chain